MPDSLDVNEDGFYLVGDGSSWLRRKSENWLSEYLVVEAAWTNRRRYFLFRGFSAKLSKLLLLLQKYSLETFRESTIEPESLWCSEWIERVRKWAQNIPKIVFVDVGSKDQFTEDCPDTWCNAVAIRTNLR